MDAIIEKVKNKAIEFSKEIDSFIEEVSFVKEHGIKILRVIADSSEGLDIDKATYLNNKLSEWLDEVDFIKEEYYLEVSSVGLERELKNDEQIKKAIGSCIYISLYEKLDNQKEFYGDLISFEENTLIMKVNIKGRIKEIKVPKEKISKIRMAVKF